MNKLLHISHGADVDGVTPVILSNLVFGDLDSIFLEASEIDATMDQLLKDHTLETYDQIFITDLCPTSNIADQIISNPELCSKIKVFDHHHSRLAMNSYSFIKVIDIDGSGHHQSGTSLYYQYLLEKTNHDILKKESCKTMVSLVRLLDTWEWKQENCEEALLLGNLLDIYGREYYQQYFTQFLKDNDTFYLDEKQKYLLEIEQIRINHYIEKKEQEIISMKLENHQVGVVFAELYRSALGNVLAEKYQQYDFIIVVNISRSISYRGIKDIDLGSFAIKYGGSGHINAAGSPLPTGIQQEILNHLFLEGNMNNGN